MIILGIYGAYGWDPSPDYPYPDLDLWVHNSSATLIVDGELKGSIAEERLTRIKYCGEYPKNSIDSLLYTNNITKNDIDQICYTCGPCYLFHVYQYNNYMKNNFEKKFPNAEVTWIPHHLAHASATFYTSGFDEANVLTLDTAGSILDIGFEKLCQENGAFSTFNKNDITKNIIHQHITNDEYTEPDKTLKNGGLGSFYSVVSSNILKKLTADDFNYNMKHRCFLESAPGKIMGLSGYSNRLDKLKLPTPFKVVKYSDHHMPIIKSVMDDQSCVEKLETIIKEHDSRQIAYWLQKVFEETVIEYLKLIPEGIKKEKLCIGGGCGLNILTNTRILEEGIYDEVFVNSAPNDEGLSLGTALYIAKKLSVETKIPSNIATIGLSYSNDQILASLKKYNDKVYFQNCGNDYLYDKVVNVLIENKIVGWFQGKSEFGPRALCNRSILANPTHDNRELLNTKVKKREYWRPYAAAILKDDFKNWFDAPYEESPYMLFSAMVKQDKRNKLPSITHVDGTCRPQTIDRKRNERAFDLLSKFKEKTGIPLLLNTSYNTIPSEPIVETPEDAIKSFLYSNIDCLAIGNFFVTKKLSEES